MEFKKIKIKNFKKIKELELNFKNTQIIPIVGLNESGKTTILEAINFINDYEKIVKSQMKDIVPINLLSNFNDKILISYSFLLSKDDILKIEETSFFIDNNLCFLNKDKPIEIEFNIGMKYLKSNIEEQIFYISNANNLLGKRIEHIDNNLEQIDINKWFNFFNEFLKNELFQKIIFIPNDLTKVADGIEIENYDKTRKSNINYANEICKKGIEEILKSNNLLNDDESLYDLLEFKEQEKERYDQIIYSLKSTIISKFNELWSEILERDTKINLEINIDVEDKKIKFYILDDHKFDLEKRSEGFKWFFLFVVVSSFYVNKNIIFLLDEPANNLHPIAQEKIVKHFENNLLKNNNKIIYTTHSSYMIKPIFLEGAFVIESNYNLDDNKNKNIQIIKYKEISNNTNELYYKPIIDSLGYKPPFFELFQNKLAVVLEGKTDAFFFNYLFDKYFANNKKIDINFIPCKGAEQTNNIISLLIAFRLNFIVLYDGDNEGYKMKEKNKKFFENDIFFTYSDILNTNNILDNKTTCKLENFVSKEFWEKMKKNNKKEKDSFFKTICEEGWDIKKFDKETKGNFEKIWNFLNDKFNLFFNIKKD